MLSYQERNKGKLQKTPPSSTRLHKEPMNQKTLTYPPPPNLSFPLTYNPFEEICPLYPSLQNYGVVLERRVLVLVFFLFFFFLKKKVGGGEGNRGGWSHPLRPVWGGRSHPQALGGGSATPKGQKKKRRKEREKEWVWAFGGGRTTPFLAKGWLEPPPTAGVAEWGGSSHPDFLLFLKKKKKKKKILLNFFF
jgi:hypothetical protein